MSRHCKRCFWDFWFGCMSICARNMKLQSLTLKVFSLAYSSIKDRQLLCRTLQVLQSYFYGNQWKTMPVYMKNTRDGRKGWGKRLQFLEFTENRTLKRTFPFKAYATTYCIFFWLEVKVQKRYLHSWYYNNGSNYFWSFLIYVTMMNQT